MGKRTKSKKSVRRYIAIITIFVMLVNLMPVGMRSAYAAAWDGTSIATGYAGGDGSLGNPYQIATGEQLAHMASEINSSVAGAAGACYILTADIDLNNHPWTPISNVADMNACFSGTFDGKGHTISNLSIGGTSLSPNTTLRDAGLFQTIYGGTVKNVGILNSNIFMGYTDGKAGSLAASVTGDGTHIATVTNCYVTGTISSAGNGGNYGGLIGSLMYGNVTKCYTAGSVLCGDQAVVGGLVGQCQDSSTIKSCYSTATTIATSGSYAASGGLVGWMNNATASIVNSYATGNVTNGIVTYIGGLAGDYAQGTITNCYYNSSATQSVSGVYQTVKGVGDLADTTIPKTLIEMKDVGFVTALNTGYVGTWTSDASNNNQGFPVLSGVTSVSSTMYKITYDGNGNTSGTAPVDTGAYAGGSSVSLSANTGDLLRTGYSFIGWNTQADGLGASYNVCSAYTVSGNIRLYASWAADAGAPIVSLSSTASSTTNASSIPVTVSFNKSVTGFDVDDITVANGAKNNFIGSGGTYSFDITPTTDGAITVDVAAGVAKDASNQDNTAATRLTLISDRTAPSATISTSSDNTRYSPISVNIAFSEGVTGFTEDDVTVTNGTKGAISGSVSGYTLYITPSAQGEVTVNVPAGGAIDAAGNYNAAATQYTITYDSIAPTVAITSTALEPTHSSPIPITITFSEAVTGFTEEDIYVGHGSASSFSGSGTTYTVNVIPSSNATVTVDIYAASAQDAAGNNNTIATQFVRTYTTTAATVTTQAVTDITATTATENGNITSLGVPDPTQYGVVWGTSENPTVALSTKTEQGAISATGAFTSSITGLTPGTLYHVRAYATNDAGTSYGDDVSFTTTSAPSPTTTITSAVFSNDSGTDSTDFITKTAAQTISGTLSANIATGETVEVSLDNGTSWTIATCTIGTNVWSLSGQTLTGSSTLKVRVKNSGGSGSEYSQAYILDTLAPTTTISSLALSEDTGASSTDFITNTAAQTISGALNAGLAAGEKVYGSLDYGSLWTDITSKVSGTTLTWNGVILSGTDTLLIKITDAAGNEKTAASKRYALDTTIPTVSAPRLAVGSDTGLNTTDNITDNTTPTFSGTAEPYSTVTLYDIGGIPILTTSSTYTGGFWSVTTTPLSMGTHSITAKAKDTAGNESTVSPALEVTIITSVAPEVTTQAVTSITSSSATGNGNITNLGVPNPTQYGVVWSTSMNPNISLSTKTQNGIASTTGAFASSITGLNPGTTYYLRAYATGFTGTSYGNEVTFTTSAAASTDATLKSTSTIKGQTITSLGTPNSTLGSVVAGTVVMTSSRATDTSNASGFITLFDKNDINASVKVVKYASGTTDLSGFETATAYSNEAITNGDFFVAKVTAQDTVTVNYYKIVATVSVAPSSDAVLTSVLSQAISVGSEAGTLGAPKTANINVGNSIVTVATGDIVKHDAGATVTFYGMDHTYTTEPATGISLTAGGTTNVYIKVVAEDGTTAYYTVAVNRAAPAPMAPVITVNDTTNKLVGADSTMEYSTDGGVNWINYNPLSEPTFAGSQTVKIRVKASGSTMAGTITTVAFTVNPTTGGGTGGSGGSGGGSGSGGSGGSGVSGGTSTAGTTSSGTSTPAAKTEIVTIDVKNGSTDNAVSKIMVERKTDVTGSKVDTVTYQPEKATETIAKLAAEGNNVARLEIPDVNNEVSKTTVNIPSRTLNVLSDGNINLQIDTQDAKIEISKEALDSVNNKVGDRLYFDLVPVKAGRINEVANRAKFEVGVLSGNTGVKTSVVGTPLTIETNMPSTSVDITLPLEGVDIPTDALAKEAFLKQLGVFIEHSDGSKELVQGKIVEYTNGKLGIKFPINKFSTFTIVKMDSISKSADCNIKVVTAPKNAILEGQNISASVTNENTSIVVKITTDDKATWKLFSDKSGKKKLVGNKLKLKAGVNQAYILVTAEDGKTTKVYSLKITRTAKHEKIENEAETYNSHIKLGLIGSKAYAERVAKAIEMNCNGVNVIVKKEGEYYRVYADFVDKAAAVAACKELKSKKIIINYYFVNK